MPAFMGRKGFPLRHLRDSVWRICFISEEPNLIDEFYEVLMQKARKAATTNVKIKVEKPELVLTWPSQITYNCADAWVYQETKSMYKEKVYRLSSEHNHPPQEAVRPPGKRKRTKPSGSRVIKSEPLAPAHVVGCAQPDLRDSVWRVQFISEDPDLVDEAYQVLKLKADKAATADVMIKLENPWIIA